LLFLFLAKQTLESAHHEFGADFSDGTMVSLRSLSCSAKRVSWQARIARILAAANIRGLCKRPIPESRDENAENV
jgi:hypothetical protein